ncbi:unnamed protein product [Moneuplotes crassus]|uniref:Uncharacterized protein n=1 Tax=Euplotes crassus TaxID=5936 RepID=A0AAD1U2P7_EUPCR|nr:unnamed protein product [Moneuplotes crassus]
MKFDSISSIVEICPYYGTLDEVYILLLQLNRKTKGYLTKSAKALDQIILARKVICLGKEKLQTYMRRFRERIAYRLFKMDTIVLEGNSCVNEVIQFIKHHPEPRFLKFTSFEVWLSGKNDPIYWNTKFYQDKNQEKRYLKVIEKLELAFSKQNLPTQLIESIERAEVVAYRYKQIKYCVFLIDMNSNPRLLTKLVKRLIRKEIKIHKIIIVLDFSNYSFWLNYKEAFDDLEDFQVKIIARSIYHKSINAYDFIDNLIKKNQVELMIVNQICNFHLIDSSLGDREFRTRQFQRLESPFLSKVTSNVPSLIKIHTPEIIEKEKMKYTCLQSQQWMCEAMLTDFDIFDNQNFCINPNSILTYFKLIKNPMISYEIIDNSTVDDAETECDYIPIENRFDPGILFEVDSVTNNLTRVLGKYRSSENGINIFRRYKDTIFKHPLDGILEIDLTRLKEQTFLHCILLCEFFKILELKFILGLETNFGFVRKLLKYLTTNEIPKVLKRNKPNIHELYPNFTGSKPRVFKVWLVSSSASSEYMHRVIRTLPNTHLKIVFSDNAPFTEEVSEMIKDLKTKSGMSNLTFYKEQARSLYKMA